MGSMKAAAASLAHMPVTCHGGEVSGKQGDMTTVLMLSREAPPEAALDPAVAAALAPPLVADAPEPSAAMSFFARCARRIRKFAERQSHRIAHAENLSAAD